jgi:hypothetical protein
MSAWILCAGSTAQKLSRRDIGNMTQGKLLVSAVLLAGAVVCAGGALPAATIVGGFTGSGGPPFAADADFADAATLGEWLPAPARAIRIPGIDDEGVIGGPAVNGVNPLDNRRAVVFPSLDFTSEAADSVDGEPLGTLAGTTVLDLGGTPSPPEDFASVSGGVSIDLIGDLVTAPTGTVDSTPPSVADDDLLFEDAVPVLAALGLLAAGFLLLRLGRRHRRAVVARRVKRQFGGRGARAARDQNRS